MGPGSRVFILDHAVLNRRIDAEVFYKEGDLINFAKITGKDLCPGSLFLKKNCRPACNFIKKRPCLAQVFSYEFFKISKTTFSDRTPAMVAFVSNQFGNLKGKTSEGD